MKAKRSCDKYPCELVNEYSKLFNYTFPNPSNKEQEKDLSKKIRECPNRIKYKGLEFCHVMCDFD